MTHLLKALSRSFSHLFFPKLCLCCSDYIADEGYLCEKCLPQLELIQPSERCPLCFSMEYCPEQLCCTFCKQQPPLLQGIAAAFDYVGPAAVLVRKLKYGQQPYLAKGAAAFMAAQFLALDWPLPNRIVPVPLSLMHHWQRGYNQSLLLAEQLSKILQVPICDALKRYSGDYSQAGLNQEQRHSLNRSSFALKKDIHLHDSTILLIDDVMTTSTTLRCCAEILLEGCPANIYGLTLCRAIK